MQQFSILTTTKKKKRIITDARNFFAKKLPLLFKMPLYRLYCNHHSLYNMDYRKKGLHIYLDIEFLTGKNSIIKKRQCI